MWVYICLECSCTSYWERVWCIQQKVIEIRIERTAKGGNIQKIEENQAIIKGSLDVWIIWGYQENLYNALLH